MIDANTGFAPNCSSYAYILVWAVISFCSPCCSAASSERLHGIASELVVNAVAGADMEQVVIYDDRGVQIYTRAHVSQSNVSFMNGVNRVPLSVRAVWRKGAGWDSINRVWNDGVVAGDYTVLVAERIPDAVISEIHAHGGGLRLKFRLKPDGILFGWDITRKSPQGNVSIFELPGGDFIDTRY